MGGYGDKHDGTTAATNEISLRKHDLAMSSYRSTLKTLRKTLGNPSLLHLQNKVRIKGLDLKDLQSVFTQNLSLAKTQFGLQINSASIKHLSRLSSRKAQAQGDNIKDLLVSMMAPTKL